MSADRLSFARVLRRLALQAGKVLVRHPTPEALTAYDAGELPAGEAEQIREHFVHCRECPELLLDYQRFAASAGGEESPPDPAVAAAWLALRRRVAGDAAARRRPPALRLAHCLSFLFLFAVAGLALWVLDLRREVRRLGEPQVNLPVESVMSPAGALRQAGWVRRIAVPAGAERFLLLLTPAVGPLRGEYRGEYRLEIRAADGRSLWAADRLARGADGSFALGLSRRFLPAGEYCIRLLRVDAGRQALVEEFPIVLLYRM